MLRCCTSKHGQLSRAVEQERRDELRRVEKTKENEEMIKKRIARDREEARAWGRGSSEYDTDARGGSIRDAVSAHGQDGGEYGQGGEDRDQECASIGGE